MRKLSEILFEQQKAKFEKENAKKEENVNESSAMQEKYDDLLKEFGVESLVDLDESKISEFEEKLEKLIESEEINEEEKITSKEEFADYAKEILKKAHGDDYDEEKAKKMIDDIANDVDGDWSKAIGKLQAGLKESAEINEAYNIANLKTEYPNLYACIEEMTQILIKANHSWGNEEANKLKLFIIGYLNSLQF